VALLGLRGTFLFVGVAFPAGYLALAGRLGRSVAGDAPPGRGPESASRPDRSPARVPAGHGASPDR